MHMDFRNDNQLSVWALGTNGNEQWALEHNVNITQLLGRHHRSRYEFYTLVAAHPERNLISLLVGCVMNSCCMIWTRRKFMLSALFKNTFWPHVCPIFPALWNGLCLFRWSLIVRSDSLMLSWNGISAFIIMVLDRA
jgi:hypothetical protein